MEQAVCPVDQAREYVCEELLPLSSSLPAPEPFTSCPGVLEGEFGELERKVRVAWFDPSYTRYIRLRAPPGHSCCYSYCSRVAVVDGRGIDPAARCRDPRAMRETYCFDELERGSSRPAVAPFERCPQAIVPPAAVVYYAPPAALLDPAYTMERRRQGFQQCCYAWCSIGPPAPLP